MIPRPAGRVRTGLSAGFGYILSRVSLRAQSYFNMDVRSLLRRSKKIKMELAVIVTKSGRDHSRALTWAASLPTQDPF